jgi:lipopolysaccharide export system protein LptA
MTVLLPALLLAAGVTDLPNAGSGPVKVDADAYRYRIKERQTEFTGNPVRMTRGDAVLTCKRLMAQNDEAGKIVTASCQGDVRFERGGNTITCEKATFDNPRSRLTCEGNPVLRNGATVAKGTLLTYDLAGDVVTLEPAYITTPGDELETQQKALQARRKEGKK